MNYHYSQSEKVYQNKKKSEDLIFHFQKQEIDLTIQCHLRCVLEICFDTGLS